MEHKSYLLGGEDFSLSIHQINCKLLLKKWICLVKIVKVAYVKKMEVV